MDGRAAASIIGAAVLAAVAACTATTPSLAPGTPTTSSLAPGAAWFGDAAGDGTPDIVAITTIATVDAVALGIDFATTFVPTESDVFIIFGETYDGQAVCNGYLATYAIRMSPADPVEAVLLTRELTRTNPTDPEAFAHQPVEASVDDRRVTITVPRAALGDPDVLYFSVGAGYLLEADPPPPVEHSPDWVGEDKDRCHAATLE